MSSSATMAAQCKLCSSIHPYVSKVKFWSHPKENLKRKSHSHPSLQILPIAWIFVAKHIFSIVNKRRAQRCGWTKADALQLKKDWGYMIKKNREKLKSWVRQVRFLLNTCLTVIKIVFQSGASRQEHQNKERKTTKKTTNSAANKTTISCTISQRRLFYRFKQTKF